MSTVPTGPDATDLGVLAGAVERLERVVDGWEDPQRGVALAYRAALEGLHREAFRRMIARLRGDPAAMGALREVAGDEVVYAVLRHLGLLKPSLQERVEEALASVRPMLASHGGDVQLVEVLPPDGVSVRFLGACESCPASALTFIAGVKAAIAARCPEITRIDQVKGLSTGPGVNFTSPFALGGDDAGWLVAAELAELPEGGVTVRELGGQSVVLSRNGDAVTCFQNACAHLGMPFDMGNVEDGVITCPYHGFRYDLRSGECLTAPAVQLEAHAVRIVGSRVDVRLRR